jgi:hypothetical protein
MAQRAEDERAQIGTEPRTAAAHSVANLILLPRHSDNGTFPQASTAMVESGSGSSEFPVTNYDPFTERSYYNGLPEELGDYLHSSALFMDGGDSEELIHVADVIKKLTGSTGMRPGEVGYLVKRAEDEERIELEKLYEKGDPNAIDRVYYMFLATALWPGAGDIPKNIHEADYETLSDNRLEILGDHPLSALFAYHDETGGPIPGKAQELGTVFERDIDEQPVAQQVESQVHTGNGHESSSEQEGQNGNGNMQINQGWQRVDEIISVVSPPEPKPLSITNHPRQNGSIGKVDTPTNGHASPYQNGVDPKEQLQNTLEYWNKDHLRGALSRLDLQFNSEGIIPDHIADFIMRVTHPGVENWTIDLLERGVELSIRYIDQFPEIEDLDALRLKIIQLQHSH